MSQRIDEIDERMAQEASGHVANAQVNTPTAWALTDHINDPKMDRLDALQGQSGTLAQVARGLDEDPVTAHRLQEDRVMARNIEEGPDEDRAAGRSEHILNDLISE